MKANRPWYGSSKKGEYRMRLGDAADDEHLLLAECEREAARIPFNSLPGAEYIGCGWEWSVFRLHETVVKIPAGRFVEVADPRYLQNSAENYVKILRYIDRTFVAETTFSCGRIHQEYIPSQSADWIQLAELPSITRQAIRRMFSGLSDLLEQEDWMPDLDIIPQDGWLEQKNWLIDLAGMPKIIDFTSYYDYFRLSERRLQREKPERMDALRRALECLG